MRGKVLPVMKPLGVEERPQVPDFPSVGRPARWLAATLRTPLKKQRGGAISPAAFTVRTAVMWSLVEDVTL